MMGLATYFSVLGEHSTIGVLFNNLVTLQEIINVATKSITQIIWDDEMVSPS